MTTKAQKARQASACSEVMCHAWGPEWEDNVHARNIHHGLKCAVDKHAAALTGRGLTMWKQHAKRAVAVQKRESGKGLVHRATGAIKGALKGAVSGLLDGSGLEGGAIDVQEAPGCPPDRFGVAPAIPRAPAQTAEERADDVVLAKSYKDYIQKTTSGRGSNVRNGTTGMPYNIDAFRRSRVEGHGGTLTSSGAPVDTFPDRAMKSGLDLEDETPVERTVHVLYNYGGNDAPPEDITNYGLRHTPGGMKLFRS